MTQVVFRFVDPDGTPRADTLFDIILRRPGFVDSQDSVVMPKSYQATTDVNGEFTLELEPATAPYRITLIDPERDEDSCGGRVSYQFYVPDSVDPVQAQDLFIAPAPNDVPWDEAALLKLTEAVEESEASALRAENAASEAAVSAAASETSAINSQASAVASAASAAASDASATSAANSATSATASKNAAEAARIGAEQAETNTENLLSTKQDASPKLTALAAAVWDANKGLLLTGANTVSTFTLSNFALTLLDNANQGAMQTTLGLVPTASTNDTTAGRMLKVGDFGLGATGNSVTNLDTTLVSGMYSFGVAPTGGPGFNSGTLIVIASTSAETTQIAIGVTVDQFAFRKRVGGSWSAWRTVWHDGNLVKQTSATDTTAGALMAVGAFGLGTNIAGSAGYLTDFSELNATRFFAWTAGVTAGVPVGGYGDGLFILGSLVGGGYGNAILLDYAQDKVYIKRLTAGVWQPHLELYHRGNILGTVSQSGGIPAGAIIERGSNANGEYVRWADGTQICTFNDPSAPIPNVAEGSIFRSNAKIWTYPAVFIAGPSVAGGVRHNAWWLNVTLNTLTTSAVMFSYSAVSGVSTPAADLVAIGRWF